MSNIPSLTTGCMEQILSGTDVDQPVVQILGSKAISSPEGTDRVRLLVSDGKYLNSFAMIATQLNDMYARGELAEYTIIRLDRYITSIVNKNDKGNSNRKRVLVILDATVLSPGATVGRKIGDPVNYGGGDSNKPAPTSSSSTAQQTKPAPAPQKTTMSPSTKPTQYGAANVSMISQNLSHATSCIAQLNPYSNKWVIKARITAKSPMRSWKNDKGEGKVFSVDLVDESGEIRATAFRDVAERLYDLFEVDKVYFISKCSLKPANKRFSALNNDYEMTFQSDSMVQVSDDDESGIPKVQYNFVPISQIANIEAKAAIDVIGVCSEVGEVQTFTGRTNNKEYVKREVTLIDSSNASISLVLWADDAEKFDGNGQPIVAVKGGRINEFGGGKTISSGSSFKINPDIPEGHRLRGWFDNGGASSVVSSISARNPFAGGSSSEWLSFRDAQDRNYGAGDKPDYFQVKALIHLVRDKNLVYRACPECNKKIVDDVPFHCEKCQKQYNEFSYRLRADLLIGDWLTNRWVTCFSEALEQLLGKTAAEVGPIIESEAETDSDKKEEIMKSLNFKSFIFKLRAKNESYNDVSRTKYTVVNVSPIDYKEYNKVLIKDLRELMDMGV